MDWLLIIGVLAGLVIVLYALGTITSAWRR